jgi:predicted RNA-binding protein with RPS1 domain
MNPGISTIDALTERIERDGVASLTEAERYYHALWILEASANNGGLDQYFSSVSLEEARTAAAALEAVGAHKMSAILSAAIAVFNQQVTEGDSVQSKVRALSAPEQKWLESLSRQLTDYPENLRQLSAAYVAKNEAEFKGPLNQLELWQSQRIRGANTKPKRVTVLLSATDEAKRDAQHSSRQCPQCSYPSPDYRRTCKQCGFPHGRVQ